ncbi:MAG: PP2C family serine/threonine-protein phosphatase [Pseudomonadota bacterium]
MPETKLTKKNGMLAERLENWFGAPPKDAHFSKEDSSLDLFCLKSDVGLKRADNQDRTAAVYVNSGGNQNQSFYCFVLCDGMGGMKGGSIAASIAVSKFIETLIVSRNAPPEERLQSSALAANGAVKRSDGAGTTLSAILITDTAVFSLNAGDSRIYSKSSDGSVVRHTKDDNLKEFAGGEDERLLQYIGMGEGLRPHINILEDDFEIIFLTSDGVHSLEEKVFDRLVQYSLSTTELCNRLVSTAIWTGGQDNASVIGISSSIIEALRLRRDGPEIAVWNNSSEIQIVWADREDKSLPSESKNLDAHSSESDGNEADIQLIEGDGLDLQGGRDNRGREANRKIKGNKKERRDSFGDFG